MTKYTLTREHNSQFIKQKPDSNNYLPHYRKAFLQLEGFQIFSEIFCQLRFDSLNFLDVRLHQRYLLTG